MAQLAGAKELEKVLRQLPRKVSIAVLNSALRQGANIVRKEAKARAPMARMVYLTKSARLKKIKYGHLKDNIKVTATRHRGGAAQMTVHTGRAFWGMFLEFGTSKLSARPWFSVAWEATRQEALDKIGDALGKQIEKAASTLAGPYVKMSKAFKRRLA
jgi:HK97 gp10 family phage protein